MKTTPKTEEMNFTQSLLDVLREQKAIKMKGGIYHNTQIDLTYNSNHIEGSRLTHEQTRYIFETNTLGVAAGETVNVNDITLHGILKSGTSDSRKDWFAVGDYKRLPNEVGGEAGRRPKVGNEGGIPLCHPVGGWGFHTAFIRGLHPCLWSQRPFGATPRRCV